MIAFIDYRTSNEEINSLKNLNIDVIKVPCNNNLYPAINGHVDIQLNILNSDTKTIILNKDIDNNFKKILEEKEINFIYSTEIPIVIIFIRNSPVSCSIAIFCTASYLIVCTRIAKCLYYPKLFNT